MFFQDMVSNNKGYEKPNNYYRMRLDGQGNIEKTE